VTVFGVAMTGLLLMFSLACAGVAGVVRCMPEERAPPRRLASASAGTSVKATPATSAAINQDLDITLSPRSAMKLIWAR